MTIITPAGKQDFVWSPKSGQMTKTAGTGSKEQASDKDLLFAAAKRVVKAQFDLEQESESPVDGEVCLPCGQKAEVTEEVKDVDGMGGIGEVVEDAAAAGKAGSPDAVKAVQELADKASKAEELAGKVEEAVSKVEEAVQEVKDVVGGGAKDDAGAPANDEVEIEIEVEDDEEKDSKEHEENETEEEEKAEHKDEEEKDEGEKDEIVKESVEACATAKAEMKTAANDPDDLYKLSKISPTTRKKVYTFWKDYLDYVPDYCKLMVTDFEK